MAIGHIPAVVCLFSEHVRLEFGSISHGLQGRFTDQSLGIALDSIKYNFRPLRHLNFISHTQSLPNCKTTYTARGIR